MGGWGGVAPEYRGFERQWCYCVSLCVKKNLVAAAAAAAQRLAWSWGADADIRSGIINCHSALVGPLPSLHVRTPALTHILPAAWPLT